MDEDLLAYGEVWASAGRPDSVFAADPRALAEAAGAVREGETCEAPYGRLAMFADPFGHGFCLIEFLGRGYDEIADPR